MDRLFTIIDAEQRSDVWKAARCGRLTSTDANAMLTLEGRKKGEPSIMRRDLKIRKALEKLTGEPQDDDYQNRHMAYGIAREADAFAAYEAMTGTVVRRTGFLAHTELAIGCSLDGDIDDFRGIVELKCPKSATHLAYLRDPNVPTEYIRQITHELYVSGAEWCDFVSFDDRFGPERALVVRRIASTSLDLTAYALAVRLFLKEVEEEYESILSLKGAA